MKIAMLTASISTRGAGVATAIEGLSKHLCRLGHDVKIFALSDDLWDAQSETWSGAPVSALKIVGPDAIGYAPSTLDLLSAFAPDIVHVHGLWMHPVRFAYLYRRATRCPYVVSPHGMLASEALKYSRVKKLIASRLFHQRSLDKAAAFHATSVEEEAQIRQFGLAQPIEAFPNGIDVIERPAVVNEHTILSLGRLHPVKGLDILVRAWAQLESKYPIWRLRIIGPDDTAYADTLGALVAQLGCDRVTIEPPIYGAEKYQTMAQAAMFALPSHTENFGLTVVESLMMETPVIASKGTPWAGLRDQQCGAWVEATPEDFSAALDRYINMDQNERRLHGVRGREWVNERFSWSSVAKTAEAAYLRTISGNDK